MFSDERVQRLITLCQEFIQSRSYSGEEDGVAAKMKNAFKSMGFDDIYVDRYGNVLGHIKGNKPGPKILFDGHMDTVPVPDPTAWNYDPYGAIIKDGKIYGRGASDMKGSVAAMICAASYYANDTAKDFAGDIYVAGVVHEECFEGVAAREISKKISPDYVVIGEASELNLKIGQRGRAEIVVETYGKPAHSANPQNGINAVYKMVGLVEKIRGIKMTHDDVLGYGILELTDIKSSPYPGASVVPDYCRATYDRRLLVGETPESVLKPVQDIISQMEKADPQFKGKAYYAVGEEKCYTGETIKGERFFPGWLFKQEDDFVQAAYNSLKDIGLNPEITQYSFCTNGSHYAGEAGIKTLGFGPSKENIAHTINEYIEIEQLKGAAAGYYAIIKALLK